MVPAPTTATRCISRTLTSSRGSPVQNGDADSARIAVHESAKAVGQPDLGVPHLPRPRVSPELLNDLHNLYHPRGPHRVALGLKPSARVGWQPPVDGPLAPVDQPAPVA